jgi:hypothetical protein
VDEVGIFAPAAVAATVVPGTALLKTILKHSY